ncbi:hypothetical protein BDF22DRAFT_699345 [Syncephalis plumigaleata]|nr:hypothetical protein BDF22DRAFT_699345 [Syncephalis plumigaleata]
MAYVGVRYTLLTGHRPFNYARRALSVWHSARSVAEAASIRSESPTATINPLGEHNAAATTPTANATYSEDAAPSTPASTSQSEVKAQVKPDLKIVGSRKSAYADQLGIPKKGNGYSSNQKYKSYNSNSHYANNKYASSRHNNNDKGDKYNATKMANTSKSFNNYKSSLNKYGAAKTATTAATATAEAAKPSSSSTFHSKHYMPLPGEVVDLVQRLKIPHRPGTTSLDMAVRCPSCSKSSSTKGKWPEQPYATQYTARLDKLSGTFNCHSCGINENWIGFLHMIRAPEVVGDANTIGTPLGASSHDSTDYHLPKIDAGAFARHLHDHPDILAWASGTEEGQMHIKPEVLQAYGVGVGHLEMGQLDDGHETATATRSLRKRNENEDDYADVDDVQSTPIPLYISFPQVGLQSNTATDTATDRSTGTALTVTRIRIMDWSNHERALFDPAHSASPGLFGYPLAFNAKERTIVITPREFDAMAVYQATNVPAISLPDGQYQLPLNVLPLLEKFDKVYLWLDDDLAGNAAAARLAHKLGLGRCYLVNGKNNSTSPGEQANSTSSTSKKERPLNAWEALVAGCDLKEMLDNAKPHEHRQVITFNRLRDEIFREVLYPEQLKGVQSRFLPMWNGILKGHRPGELSIVTGPTGAGKTTVISQLSLDFCESGISTLWGSFEIANARLAKKMLFQYAGQDLSLNPQLFDEFANRFEQLPMYFMKFFGSTQISAVLDAMQYALYAYDVQHVIIDNLQFMTSGQGRGMERWEIQDDALSLFRRFATDNNVHVTLVVHPRKEDKEHLDINSIFGSAKVTQEADNVIILQKLSDDIRYLDVKKNRFDGALGVIPYRYNPHSLRVEQLSEDEVARIRNPDKE